jgi:hypothetical protein
MMSRARRALVLSAAVCAASLAITGCRGSSGGDDPGMTADGPIYDSIEALTAAAEVVVLGSVGEVRGTEVDDGGNEDGDGIDVTFTSVTVDEVLSGRATTVQAGDTLAVGVSDAASELSEGDEMVLFLEQLTHADAPGIDTEDVFYVIIGIDANGAFDVQDGAVIARSSNVRGLATVDDAESDEPFTTSIPELRAYFTAR